MPKSKNRKGQKQKAQARTSSIKAGQARDKKNFMEMLNNFQQQSMQKQESNIVEDIDVGDIEDINTETQVIEDTTINLDVDIDNIPG